MDLDLILPSAFKSLKKLNLLKSLISFMLVLPLIIFLPISDWPCQLSVSRLTGELCPVTFNFCLRKSGSAEWRFLIGLVKEQIFFETQ